MCCAVTGREFERFFLCQASSLILFFSNIISSSSPIGYVRCSYAWLDLVQKYYSEREMFVLLGNLAARLEETYSLESRVEVRVRVLFSSFSFACVRATAD